MLDGRSYDFLGAQQVQTPTGQTTELTLGSAGGHVDTKPDPGIIQHPARFAILYVDPDRDQARYAVVTVDPDASVDITAPVPFGAPGP